GRGGVRPAGRRVAAAREWVEPQPLAQATTSPATRPVLARSRRWFRMVISREFMLAIAASAKDPSPDASFAPGRDFRAAPDPPGPRETPRVETVAGKRADSL